MDTGKNNRLIIKDPLYKNIVILNSDKKYIETFEFQRLRNIKQLSFVDFVFPSANHTRFSHSIGAYNLMRKVLLNGYIKADSKTKTNLRLAALLHDIGHGPFSHLWEKVFPSFDHEKSTQDILKKFGLDEVASIIDKKSEFSSLITSTIDVDKLDYMARDSYFAGVSYGFSEVEYILENITIIKGKVVIKPKAIQSIEDLITQRVNLFKTVIFINLQLVMIFYFKVFLKELKYY